MTDFDSLPELIQMRALGTPHRNYLFHAEDRSALTYGQADMLGKAWAYALYAAEVQRNDTVLTMLPPSFGSLGIWLGASWVGAVEVPINTAYRGRLLQYIIKDSQAELTVVHADFLSEFLSALKEMSHQVKVVVVGGPAHIGGNDFTSTIDSDLSEARVIYADDFLSRGRKTSLHLPTAHDIAAILYTSGTTGPSKGVLVPWTQIKATARVISPADITNEKSVFYAPFPTYHMSGKAPLMSMAIEGASIVLRSRFSTSNFWVDVENYGITTTILLGAMTQFLLSQPVTNGDSESTLNNVSMTPYPDDVEGFEERFGVWARSGFNMTETSGPITTHGHVRQDPRSCGKVREGYEARIVDEWDEEVPVGSVGELVLRTDNPWMLMAGYWNKPEATVSAWRNGWFHTGDAFRRDDDGNYYFIDRIKDAIRRRGENISSAEVEADVNAHSEVLETAAVAVPSEQSEDEVKIYVVTRANSILTERELSHYLKSRMAKFMFPRYVEIVDSLPKTPTLKIRKAELRSAGLTGREYDTSVSETGAPAVS